MESDLALPCYVRNIRKEDTLLTPILLMKKIRARTMSVTSQELQAKK